MGGILSMPKDPKMADLLSTSRAAAQGGPNRAARRRYVKVAEAAEYLQVTTRTVRQMVADGRLTAYRSGTRLVRLDLNEIDAAMKPFGGAA
jgi:excisionase family DNA binding protein